MNDNLKIWNLVKKTDISYTKKVNQRGGYTSVSPQYQLKKATEIFGPYGKGFGLCKSEFDMSLFESLGVVIHKASFFYLDEGKKIEFPISNAIQATTGFGDKKRVDVDFAKKVETNTVSKALSKLGFNSDIFMGMFEDNQYIHELSNEIAMDKAEDKNEEKLKQAKQHDEWKLKEIESYKHLNSLNALQTAFTGHVRKCQRLGDEQGIKQFTKAKDNRKMELDKND